MSDKKMRLTPAIRQQIVAGVRAGGYRHIAAAAWGVSPEMLEDWLRKGTDTRPREPYLSFTREVLQAEAQARLRAEMAVFQDEPKVWLEHGPGRERPDSAGWTVSVKPTEPNGESRNVLLDPEIMALFRTLLEALGPFPDARVEVAKRLMNAGLDAA